MSVIDDEKKSALVNSIISLGKNFFLQGKYEKAQIIFSGLFALAPDNELIFIFLGEIYLVKNDADAALQHFLGLKQKYPSNQKIMLGAAKAYLLMKDYENAMSMLQEILSSTANPDAKCRLLAESIKRTLSNAESCSP